MGRLHTAQSLRPANLAARSPADEIDRFATHGHDQFVDSAHRECIARLAVSGGPGARAPAEASDDSAIAPARSLRILVVDDNVDAAVTLSALLDMQGYEVRTAHDGVDALDEVESFRPDVVILDIGMPRMNGYTAAAHIRERADENRPLLIAVTGWGQDEDRYRSRAAGFDHHLVKPVDPAVLFELISSAARALH